MNEVNQLSIPATTTASPGVVDLYNSRFAHHYDTRARIWEHLICREAVAALHDRLQLLGDRPLSILDLGCGTGRNLDRFAAASLQIDTYTGVDSSPTMIDLARRHHPHRRAEFRHVDADAALDTDQRYDLITATWLLSHHPNPAGLIRNASASLAHGGRFVALVITESHRPRARLHGWRFRHCLHSLPVPPSRLRCDNLNFEHVSAGGLVTLVEYRADQPSRHNGGTAGEDERRV